MGNLGLALAVIGAVLLAASVLLYRTFRQDGWCREISSGMAAVYLVILLYPIGVACKGIEWGPQFMRYHLADVGFPVMIGWAWTTFKRSRWSWPVGRNENETRYVQSINWIIAMRMYCSFALVLSYGYELLEGVLHAYVAPQFIRTHTHYPLGGFDWADMACYTLGTIAALLALQYIRRYLVAMMPQAVTSNRAPTEAER